MEVEKSTNTDNDAAKDQSSGLHKGLGNRHIQLIAIGGAIGSGLFMGSGKTISLSGSSIIITYMVVGFFMFLMMRAIGELLLSNSSYNSFVDFTSEYLGNWAGFFMGWSYWLCWVISCIGDVVVIGGYIQFWFPDLSLWIPAVCSLLFLVSLNVFSVKNFGEIEFWFALIKVLAILVLIIVGFSMIFTGFTSPNGVQASLTHLVERGSIFPNGLFGFIAGFQIAIFSFMGVELLGITAGETKNPEKNLPKAINSIPLRIMLFYVLSLICIIAITSWKYVSPDKSPFVEVFALAGIHIAAALMNFVVLTSALSATNSGVFSTSRMLFGLATQKDAPHFFEKLSTKKIPLLSLLFSGIGMLIGVLLLVIIPSVMQLYTLLSTLCAILILFVWSLMLFSYLAYRKKRPDLHQKSIYKMPAGIILSYACLMFFGFALIALLFEEDTRIGMYIAPFWFLWLIFAYKYRDHIHAYFRKRFN
ncbi:D-serine/D-alanine/glycine:proton symporter (AAT family) [Acinetobacter calcoaceticus]|uniref:D-serine/D-alanine/glycine:proton symporter (AAT family) n=1 Tax=Acinetobacter calcoaceticus TaxID=471 RepID=A0A4R1XZN4_ACICA|nr:D-serine/D-alanine/glycine:proton symporter (AAT family) [Acinetobacter calcoaceticus]